MQYSISHFKNQTFVLFLFRQPNGHHRAAALGIADVKGTTMESDDLIAHRKTDAAAPGLGGALVKLLLYIGQLRLWNAGAVVPDTDDLLRPLRCQRGVNAPPGASNCSVKRPSSILEKSSSSSTMEESRRDSLTMILSPR